MPSAQEIAMRTSRLQSFGQEWLRRYLGNHPRGLKNHDHLCQWVSQLGWANDKSPTPPRTMNGMVSFEAETPSNGYLDPLGVTAPAAVCILSEGRASSFLCNSNRRNLLIIFPAALIHRAPREALLQASYIHPSS